MKRRRQGGLRQRQQAKESEEADEIMRNAAYTATSVLATYLLTMFAQGEFTPQRVQHIAALVLADIKALQSNPSLLNDLEVMAGIGASGKYPNKMHGDLMQHTKHVSRLPAPRIFRTTFKAPVGEQNTSMLLPHEFFATIFAEYKATWLQSICPGQDDLAKFWHNAKDHPLMLGHPVQDRHGWERLCIHLGVHGDGVPVVGIGKAWSKVLNVWSWFSLIGVGNTRSKMFYTFSCFDKISIPGFPNGTLGPAFKLLHWSFYWLYQGVWPDRDANGNVQLVLWF